MHTRHDNKRPWWARSATLAVFFMFSGVAPTWADAWNDRTTMTFSAPVMVPGATLPAGEYVFQLMDLKANRHLVEIRRAADAKVLALTHAVPVKRARAEDTTTLTFNPTAEGRPPAMKAWYYPGSVYGHEFIYPAEEARRIASREKTIVLSEDRGPDDAAAGSLRLYGADGSDSTWRADDAVIREWTSWTSRARARARSATDAAMTDEGRAATAPLVDATGAAMRVTLDDLEDRPRQYIGTQVSVDAEVEKVLGPRLFTIDEPNWADLDGELLVHVPTALAALVRADDRITITGTVRAFADVRLDDDRQWFDGTANTASWTTRPVLVASRVTGGDSDRAVVITRDTVDWSPNAATSTPLRSLDKVTAAAVGSIVDLDDVTVERMVPGHGFFVSSGSKTVFVHPIAGQRPQVSPGDSVSIDGFVLTLPPGMKEAVAGEARLDTRAYVFATGVS